MNTEVLSSHCTDCYANAPRCYVPRTWSILLVCCSLILPHPIMPVYEGYEQSPKIISTCASRGQ